MAVEVPRRALIGGPYQFPLDGGAPRDLQRELGLSYLFSTHNIGVVEYVTDEVAVMSGGHIVEHGACTSVLQRPRHEYTRSLLAAVPRLERMPA